MRKNILLIIIILWVSFIFYNSLQPGVESLNTSNSIVFLVEDFFLTLGIEIDISILSIIIRKLAHIFEFFVLSILLLYFLFEFNLSDKYKILYASFIALLIAIIDEFIQSFVEGRGSSVIDVCIDSIGIVLGICLIIVINYIKYRHKNK